MPAFSPTHTCNASETIPLTSYLFTRLHQLGVHSLHGVPGDYNLTALDHVAPCKLNWIGNCNELNAGYAADGYSRIKGLGALITAFGVGELSAINAIGGAYAEQAAVVHIVGTPPRAAQKGVGCLHHSLGNGDFRIFARMAQSVTVAQTNLVDESTAVEEVDRVLRECMVQSRPVYIELPTDMVNIPVDATRLSTPVDISPTTSEQEKQEQEKAEAVVLDLLLPLIRRATQPFLIIDGFTARWSIFPEIDSLVRLLGWPTTSTPFGKSCIDETLPNFHGIYAGTAGNIVYKPWVDKCDLVLRFGGLDSDVNTYGFSTLTSTKATVNFQRDHVVFGGNGQTITCLHIQSLLPKLIHSLISLDAQSAIPRMHPYPSHLGDPRSELAALPAPDLNALIAQHDFWRRISRFFHEGDVILTETGTPSVGSREFVLPRHARLINSSIWLSIGYMLAASQGAAMAVREIGMEGSSKSQASDMLGGEEQQQQRNGEITNQTLHLMSNGAGGGTAKDYTRSVLTSTTASTRTILFEGDGSFQMSAQELSTVIKHELDLTLFLINNDGYTIERFIHGMKATYNDVAPWRYLDAPRFFGGMTHNSEIKAKEEEKDKLKVLTNGANNLPSSISSTDPLPTFNATATAAQPTPSKPNTNRSFPPPPHLKSSKNTATYLIQTHTARTYGELAAILADPAVQAGKGLCMIEVFMDREDAPESLKRLVKNVKRRNSGVDENAEVEVEREGEGDEVVGEKIVKAAG